MRTRANLFFRLAVVMAACVTAGEATWSPAASPGFLLTGPGLTHDEPGAWGAEIQRRYRSA